MSPQPDVIPGVKTGPVWSPWPLRYWFPSSSMLEESIELVV